MYPVMPTHFRTVGIFTKLQVFYVELFELSTTEGMGQVITMDMTTTTT